jgi:NAD(P)H-hydrate epimerase
MNHGPGPTQDTPEIDGRSIDVVTGAQMREVDRLMVEEYGITLLQMMENAGRALAEEAREMVGGDLRDQRVVTLAGAGGNGGGGLAAARRLHNCGADVSVFLADVAAKMGKAPSHQLHALNSIGVPVEVWDPSKHSTSTLHGANLIIDALVGYSLQGALRGRAASMARAANDSATPVLALDLPSGLDSDSGAAGDPTVRAARTVTLALPKAGLMVASAHPYVGRLYVADISVPNAVYQRIGLSVGAIFSRGDIVAITDAGGSR